MLTQRTTVGSPDMPCLCCLPYVCVSRSAPPSRLSPPLSLTHTRLQHHRVACNIYHAWTLLVTSPSSTWRTTLTTTTSHCVCTILFCRTWHTLSPSHLLQQERTWRSQQRKWRSEKHMAHRTRTSHATSYTQEHIAHRTKSTSHPLVSFPAHGTHGAPSCPLSSSNMAHRT